MPSETGAEKFIHWHHGGSLRQHHGKRCLVVAVSSERRAYLVELETKERVIVPKWALRRTPV